MSGWTVPVDQGSGAPTKADYRPAGMGRRVGAWILDAILSGLMAFIPFVLAIVTGAVAFNQTALDQLSQVDAESIRPFAGITAPLLDVKMGPLVAVAVVYVVIGLLYYAGSWVAFGGTPAQRALGMRVVDVGSAKDLSIDAAVLRWAVLQGIAACIGAVTLIMALNWIAANPTSDWLDTGYSGSARASLGGASGLSNVVSLGTTLWSIILLVSASTNVLRRGIHDRIVGSIVVVPALPDVPWNAPQYPAQTWGSYPQTPGYPPQGYGYPQYPPQGQYPPAPPAEPPTQPQPPSGPPSDAPGQ